MIVLGDARTNGRPPREDVFAAIAAKAGRTFWLNPEPKLYWNYGDSVISVYEQFCEAFECWRTDQLEEFVKALTQPTQVIRVECLPVVPGEAWRPGGAGAPRHVDRRRGWGDGGPRGDRRLRQDVLLELICGLQAPDRRCLVGVLRR